MGKFFNTFLKMAAIFCGTGHSKDRKPEPIPETSVQNGGKYLHQKTSNSFINHGLGKVPPPPHRLPTAVVPRHYDLAIMTDCGRSVFHGEVDIEIECMQPTETIKLHSKGLKIDETKVALMVLDGGKLVNIRRIQYDSTYDFMIINVQGSLKKGTRYVLYMRFSNSFNEGFFCVRYGDHGQEQTKWIAATFLRPAQARQVFPCFDEPSMKAEFTISLGHTEGLKAISNMPLQFSESPSTKEGVWDVFERSEAMSTFHVFFLVGHLEQLGSIEENGKHINYWTIQGVKEGHQFGESVRKHFMVFYESFFGITYPLPKLDVVARPVMDIYSEETWGFQAFRLVADQKTAAASVLDDVVCTVAHQLAHQWLGALVTCKWWSDFWLGESLVDYIGILARTDYHKTRNVYNFEIAMFHMEVLEKDGLVTSLAVSPPQSENLDAIQLEGRFDKAVFSKGVLLINMLATLVGEDTFKEGIRAYLKDHLTGNADSNDLWAAMAGALKKKKELPPGVTVKKVMDSWTSQRGFPILHLRLSGGKTSIKQERFRVDKWFLDDSAKDQAACWWVPVRVQTASRPESEGVQWVGCDKPQHDIETGAGDGWFIVKPVATGLCLVNYEKSNWEKLADLLGSESGRQQVDELSRVQLITGAMAQASAQELDYETAFRLLRSVQKETAHLPWLGALDALLILERRLHRTTHYQTFQGLVRGLLQDVYPVARALSSPQEPGTVAIITFRQWVLNWACLYDVADCSKWAVATFNSWRDSNQEIPEEERSVVFCEGVKQLGESAWNHVLQKYQEAKTIMDKKRLMKGLACTPQSDQLNRLLGLLFDKSSEVPVRLAFIVFENIVSLNFAGTFEYWEKNIRQIYDRLYPATCNLSLFMEALAEHMVFKEDIMKMDNIVNMNKDLFLEVNVKSSMRPAHMNVKWLDMNKSISDKMKG